MHPKITLICCWLFCQFSLTAQNCDFDSTGLIPIPDLAGMTYRGYPGGLYFDGNTKPEAHREALQATIAGLQPLNATGMPVPETGKIVLLSIGASNPANEFAAFQERADTFSRLHPDLAIVNGCRGGKSLQKILNPDDSYWAFVENQLEAGGLTREQVQIIWLEQEHTQNPDTSFPGSVHDLMAQFRELFAFFLEEYPQLQLVYLTARGYSGYALSGEVGAGLEHPRDYLNGWAVKWLIEDQIDGDTALTFSGPDRKAPLLTWGPYLWADGSAERSDGLRWRCPEDVSPDGLHWSAAGNAKAGRLLFDHFQTDSEARLWFTAGDIVTDTTEAEPFRWRIFPNPTSGPLTIQVDQPEYLIRIFSTAGVLLRQRTGSYETIIDGLPNGVYWIQILTAAGQVTQKVIVE